MSGRQLRPVGDWGVVMAQRRQLTNDSIPAHQTLYLLAGEWYHFPGALHVYTKLKPRWKLHGAVSMSFPLRRE